MAKKLLWIAAMVFSLVLGSSAFAGSDHCGQKIESFVSGLNLDDSQKAKIQPIVDQLKSSMKANWSKMKDIRMQMNQQIMSDKMDQSVVDGLADQRAKMMSDMMKARASAMNQIWGVLNEKQKAACQDMMKKWAEKAAAWHESCAK